MLKGILLREVTVSVTFAEKSPSKENHLVEIGEVDASQSLEAHIDLNGPRALL
jgi:hypothetical protein